MMTVIEKRLRLICEAETAEHQANKIETVRRECVGADHHRLGSAAWHLREAARLMRSVPCGETEGELARLLQVSVSGIREMQACEAVAAEADR